MRSKVLGVCTVLLLVSGPATLGADWYISPTGSDANNCRQATPCKTAARGISLMNDGDTLWVADGQYTTGAVGNTGCAAGNTLIYVGVSKSCPNLGCAIRAQNVTSPPSVTFTGTSAGVVVNRAEGWTFEGLETVARVGIVQCKAKRTLYRDMRIVATGPQSTNFFNGGSDATLERVETYRQGKPCELSNFDNAYGFVVKDFNDLTISESYLGYTFHLMLLTRVNGFTLKRSRLEHWVQHGIQLNQGVRNVLIENNIMGGTGRAGCSTSRMVGPRLIDLYEVHDLTVRNNTIIGHGYSPRSAVISYFHFGNAYGGCELSASEPGFCEFDKTVSCAANDIPKIQGVAYSATSSQCPKRNDNVPWSPNQRCSGVCDLENVKFYNNIVFDLRDTGEPEAGTKYIDWLSQEPWSETVNLTLDGNYYAGGVRGWICKGSNGQKTTLAEWRAAQCVGGPNPDQNSVVGHCSGSTVQACGADNDCPGSQTCVIGAPAFVNYTGGNYRPTTGATQIDAGVGGVDSGGVARCASEDFDGNPRTDGACDIGAFEGVGDGTQEPPPTDPPGQVQNPQRADTRN